MRRRTPDDLARLRARIEARRARQRGELLPSIVIAPAGMQPSDYAEQLLAEGREGAALILPAPVDAAEWERQCAEYHEAAMSPRPDLTDRHAETDRLPTPTEPRRI
jgi:hypothetical protein